MLIRLDDEDIVRLGRYDRLGKRSQEQSRQQLLHRAKACRLVKRLAMLGDFLVFSFKFPLATKIFKQTCE